MDPVVTTEWLAKHLGESDVRVVDGTWHMPQAKRDARAEFEAAHVPGAVFFDIDAVADRTSSLPHMLPSARRSFSFVKNLLVQSKSAPFGPAPTNARSTP